MGKTTSAKNKIKEMVYLILGTICMAAAVNLVYEPMNMVTGGVTGFAIIIKNITEQYKEGGIPIWCTNILVNIPLFLVAWKIKGISFVKKILFATILFTIALYIIPVFDIASKDYLLASVFGGVITGIGLGFVLMSSSSTGGTDLLSILLHEVLPHYTIPQLLMIIDCIIVLGGVIVFGVSHALYAIIAVYITAKVSDSILEGLKFAKLIYIISDQYEEIAQLIQKEVQRGVTGLNGSGMYTKKEKKILFCVVGKKQLKGVIDIVAKKDPKAFVIISDVREVVGEGFITFN